MKQENNAKRFDLGAVLTVSTKRLLTDIDDLYKILNYLTGEQIYTHQIPRALLATSQYVLDVWLI